MLELEQALEQILGAVPAPNVESIALGEGLGRVLTEPLLSPIDLPVFDNSAMDGYAVRAADVAAARVDAPVRLKVIGRVAAGDSFCGEIASGSCVRLFTGSALPRGADAVVMQEDTFLPQNAPGEILVLEAANPGENVRRQGEDVKKGTVVGRAGDRVRLSQIGLWSAAGVARVQVGQRPRVGVVASGSELREPGETLGPGQIYESNRVMLTNLVQGTGALARAFPLVPDTLQATRDALDRAFSECDAVVTSGGVSVGEMDFLKPAFADAGGDLQFWKVAIRPGRPFVFGRRKGKLLFGLPGNPVSALVTFLLLVRPALLRWQGATDVALAAYPGVLAEPLANPGNRRHFMRVKMNGGKVYSAGAQASHMLSSLAAAEGLIDVAPETHLPAGASVRVMRWD